MYGLNLPHYLNIETELLLVKAEPAKINKLQQVLKLTGEQMTRTEPAQVKYSKRLKVAQCFLCYYHNLLS